MSPFRKKDLVDLLKLEMSIIEGGGYGRSLNTPWRQVAIFRDSVTCLNVGETDKRHPCGDCFLIEHVPDDHRGDEIPCHHIPLNEKGETVEELSRKKRREDLEQALLDWIRATIKKLEHEPD